MKTNYLAEAMFEASPNAATTVGQGHDNPFLQGWMVEPAIRHLGAADEIGFAPLADGEGFIPLARWRNLPPGIGNVYSIWSHLHCFDTTAPVSDSFAAAHSIQSELLARGASMLRWPRLPADTTFHARLLEWLAANDLEVQETKRFARPVLDADIAGGSEAALARLSCKRVRELRRTRRRLEEMGRLEFRVIDGPHDPAIWIHEFIEIEASGWKGGEGTAFAHRPSERDFLLDAVKNASEEGHCIVYALYLDARMIAASINFRAGRKVWAFKTAYRDELSKFSPGALLEFEAMLAACDDPSIGWIDSCMSHEGGLIGELWPGRREVVDLLISTRPSNNRMVRVAGNLWRAYVGAKRSAREAMERTGYSRAG